MYFKSATSNLGRGYAVTLKGWNEKANSFVNRPPSSHIAENPLPLCVLHLYIITCSLKGLCHGCLAHFVYLSNRPHFYWFTGVITHAGCWENTRKAYQSRGEGEWFTSLCSVLPTSILAVRFVISMNTTEKEFFEFFSRKSLSDTLNGH